MALNKSAGTESELSVLYHIYKHDFNDTLSQGTSLFGLSREGEVEFKFIVYGLLLPIVALFGTVGNLISILILSRKRMRSPLSAFLRTLAIADLLGTTLCFPILFIPSIHTYAATGNGSNAPQWTVLMMPYLLPAVFTVVTSSTYLTVAVTVERYVAVCHPLKASALLTYNAACLSSAGIIILSFLCNVPRWFEYNVVPIFDFINGKLVGYRPVPTALRMHPVYDAFYVNLSFDLFVLFLPLIALCVLNLRIYCAVRTANKQRQVLSPTQKNENSLAVMLLVIVAISILTNSVPLLDSIQRKVFGLSTEVILEVECLRNFLSVFNCSINFVVYSVMSSKFQAELKHIWRSCLPLTPALASCLQNGSKSTSGRTVTSSHSSGSSTLPPVRETTVE